MSELTFRMAEERDVPLILSFIRDLADYEQMLDQVVADPETLRRELFERHRAEVLFAVEEGREVGFALFFHNFSTFLGRAGLYLEDLFVRPECRGKGYGKAILCQLARIALDLALRSYANQLACARILDILQPQEGKVKRKKEG